MIVAGRGMPVDVNLRGKTRERTIAAGFGDALVKHAMGRGASESQLCERAGVRTAELADADARLPMTRYVALLKAGAELCEDPAFALKFGAEVRLEDVSIAGLIGMA